MKLLRKKTIFKMLKLSKYDIYIKKHLILRKLGLFYFWNFISWCNYVCLFLIIGIRVSDLCPLWLFWPVPISSPSPTPTPTHSQPFHQTTLSWTSDLQITLKTHLRVRMRGNGAIGGGSSLPLSSIILFTTLTPCRVPGALDVLSHQSAGDWRGRRTLWHKWFF